MAISLTRLSGGNTPADGSDPRTFPAIWNASATAIEGALADTGASVTVSETAPVSPAEGDLWLNSTEAKMYVYYDDGSSAQWVAAVGGTVPQQGKILQVVQAVKSDTFSGSLTNGAFSSNIADLEATITPSSASNKILVSVVLHGESSLSFSQIGFRIMRDSTAVGIGDAAGSRGRLTARGVTDTSNTARIINIKGEFLDSPATTSAITYGVQLLNTTTSTVTYYVNRTPGDSDDVFGSRPISSITLMEVAA